jgi:hypothetical protein
MYSKTYEIYENTTGVLLVDGLTFEQVAEQSKIYMDFFETDDISIVTREWNGRTEHTTYAQAFKDAFIGYFAELSEMGNLN